MSATPAFLSVAEGERGEFICRTTPPADAPSPRRVFWKKAERPGGALQELPSNMYDDGNGRLSFYSANAAEMNGNYVCYIEESTDTATVSFLATVGVPVEAAIQYRVTLSKQTLKLSAGGSGEVVCAAEAPADAPSPDRIIWSFVGADSLPSGVFDDGRGSLSFRNAAAAQSGTYVCKTQPEEASSKASVTVIFSAIPGQGK
jgi:hypothetical protein